ncbi:uncharacterized protein I303_100041 [Kwoniella dejecticola CBS 10117]|uniref:WSC domain-containing protein n=1 Tax=Kwoniella dejecticola CBS 10117 TaxID=1296121 RepID=A0A1A6ADT9_9TREE|nr:uncharacterized protein I303_00041 [Kwoniella dejecticola CBS 10117]OBR88230.1 hypothetical protein I303_00041 [Kwoniella dejecticola CBS 10117]
MPRHTIPVLVTALVVFLAPCLAQNDAWLGCFTIPDAGISGLTVSSSQTYYPNGCANQCRAIVNYGYAPVKYAMYSDSRQIGDSSQEGHCVCTNSPPVNSAYNGGQGGETVCSNANDYAAVLLDTPYTFDGCYSSLYDYTMAYDASATSVDACFTQCQSYKWVEIDYYQQGTEVRCRCAPFIIQDPDTTVQCANTDNNYMIFMNNVASGTQPSARAVKRQHST